MHGDNAGLVIAEFELCDEGEPFERPAGLGVEVTGQQQYYNSAVAQRPYCPDEASGGPADARWDVAHSPC